MKISAVEKLILIMLCEIYEKLGIEGEIDPEVVKKAIFSEQTWGLAWEYPGVIGEMESPPIVREVVDILQMWSLIESAYDKLSDPEKEALKRAVPLAGDDLKFKGFDANNEPHYGVAQYLINELERFIEFKGRYLNSHSPLLGSYQRMLAVFKPILLKLEGRSLNVAELTEILKARIHPKSQTSDTGPKVTH
jgi:uncharacterized protein